VNLDPIQELGLIALLALVLFVVIAINSWRRRF
jgi:hypothetical protein